MIEEQTDGRTDGNPYDRLEGLGEDENMRTENCGYLQNLELNIHQTFFFMILKIWHIHICFLKTVEQKLRIYNNNLAEINQNGLPVY